MDKNITYEQIFHATSNGVVITNASGNIVYINKRAEKILRLSAKKHAGIYISKLLPLTGPQVMECLRSGKSELGHHIIGKKVDPVLDITLIHSRKKIKGAVCNFQERKPRALKKSLGNKHLSPCPLTPSNPRILFSN